MIEPEIRYTIAEDRQTLKQWLESPGELDWFPPSNEEELTRDLDLWMAFARYKASLTATDQDLPCGIATLFLMPYRKVAHHAMFRVIVAPDKRKQGIGKPLVKNLLHLGKNYFRLEMLHCDVYGNCPVIPLLEKMGFELIATQKEGVKIEGQFLDRKTYSIDLTTWSPR